MVIARPVLKTLPSGDLEQHDFLFITILASMCSRSDFGALWCVCMRVYFHPNMLVWKGLGNLGTVLYWVWFCLWWLPLNFIPIPQDSYQYLAAQLRERLQSPLGEVEWDCVTVKGRVTSYLWVSRNFAFLWCLSNGSSHVCHFPQIRKTVETPPLRSLLSER